MRKEKLTLIPVFHTSVPHIRPNHLFVYNTYPTVWMDHSYDRETKQNFITYVAAPHLYHPAILTKVHRFPCGCWSTWAKKTT